MKLIKDGLTANDLPVIPRGYRILIKQVVKEAVSGGGIILGGADESARVQKGVNHGELIAIGPECWDKQKKDGLKPWAEVGEMVQFKAYAGEQIPSGDDATFYHVMNDEDILGVVGGKV